MLDAGCGKGWFSREFARFGHIVDGMDASESAIAYCRDLGQGAKSPTVPRYFMSSLSQWRRPWLYDAVVSVDVLFHLTDHPGWERAVRNLASLVRMRGRLIVSDWGAAGDHVYGDYVIVRGT